MQHEKHNHTENRRVSLKSALIKRRRRENKNRRGLFPFFKDRKQLSAGLNWTGSYLQCCRLNRHSLLKPKGAGSEPPQRVLIGQLSPAASLTGSKISRTHENLHTESNSQQLRTNERRQDEAFEQDQWMVASVFDRCGGHDPSLVRASETEHRWISEENYFRTK